MSRFTRSVFLVVSGMLILALGAMPSAAQIPISEAREQGPGSTVTVEGTVTRAFGDFVRFQDESGPTGASGLVIRQTRGAFRDSVESDTIRQGTQLQVTGTLSEFNGLLQINEADLDDFTIQGQGTVPNPQDVSLAELRSNGENFESELVQVTEATFLNADGTFSNDTSYLATDGSGTATFTEGTLTVRVQGMGETTVGDEPIPTGAFTYTGVVGEFSGEYQLIPVQVDDLEPIRSFSFTRQFAQAEEGSGTVEVDVTAFATESGDEVSVTASLGDGSTADASDVNGFDGSQTFSFSGSDPAPKTLSFDPLDDGTTEGVERLEVVLESDDGARARPKRFTLWILDDPDVQRTIAEGDSGNALLDALQQQFGDPRPLGDDLARDSMYAVVYSEPADTVEGFYSGFRIEVDPSQGDPSAIAAEKGINNEHMWPQSKGAEEEPATSDMHILTPARDVVNSARSNVPYGEIPDADTDTWYFEDQSQTATPPESDRPAWSELLSGQRFEPRHSVKGDVARAAMYFVTIYPNRASLSFWEEQRETLLEWHQQDPVDATEMRRNLIQASFQDNVANPYVLDSTLADRAFGSGGGEPGGGLLTIQEARDQGTGAAVEVEGTVTRAFGAYARIQDSSGSEGASGLTIRQTSGPNADAFQQDIEADSLRPGTRVRVRGNLSAFNGLLQVNGEDLAEYEIVDQGDPPSPQSVTLADLQAPDGEAFESVLVRADSLSFPEASGTFQNGTTYTVEDAGGTAFEFRVQGADESDLAGTSIPEGTFDFEGIVGQFNGAGFQEAPDEGYQLLGIEESDLKDEGEPERPLTIQEAREQGAGATVEVEGRVTRAFGSYARIQDDSGSEGASGLTIRQTSGSNADAFQQDIEADSLRPGTRVRVRGSLSAFNGLLQINGDDLAEYEIMEQGEPPSSQSVTLADLQAPDGEAFESVLVRVDSLSFPEASGTFQNGTTYTVEDVGGTPFEFRVQGADESDLAGTSIPEGTFDFEGIVGQFNGAGPQEAPDEGYQLLGIEESDLEAGGEPELPSETTFSITRSFGAPDTSASYRLVALPGQVDRGLASTLDGDNGLDWQAYRDDGSDEDFLVKFDGGDAFDFRPGRGFWLLSTTDWSAEGTVSTVSVENGAATIPLQDGWNIISNPLPRDVAWDAVEEVNGGPLQALWRWDNGTFEQASTFAGATTGEAFYFLNDQGLDQLSIPVSSSSGSASPVVTSTEGEGTVELVARRDDDVEARVRVAEHAGAEEGRDRQDLVAPPSQFAALTMHLRAPFEGTVPARQAQLARDVRATGASGQTYTLVLQADTTGPVIVGAELLPRSAQTEAVLLDPNTGEPHDLRTEGPMTVVTGPEPTRVRLLVGDPSYVRSEVTDRLPGTLTVESPAPNPFRDETTLRYALPEARDVRIAVYDLLGRQVQTLVDRRQDAGAHRVTWRARAGSRELANGTYLIRLSTGKEQHVEKIVLVR